jgi:hypothetical protein
VAEEIYSFDMVSGCELLCKGLEVFECLMPTRHTSVLICSFFHVYEAIDDDSFYLFLCWLLFTYEYVINVSRIFFRYPNVINGSTFPTPPVA